jgi:hypothetical protein
MQNQRGLKIILGGLCLPFAVECFANAAARTNGNIRRPPLPAAVVNRCDYWSLVGDRRTPVNAVFKGATYALLRNRPNDGSLVVSVLVLLLRKGEDEQERVI